MHLLATASLDDASVSALLQSVRGISSSGSRARVLITAAERVRDSSELRAVYEDVARGFSSSGDRRRVLAAIGLNRSEA
jgi:hypothetical protein